MISDNVIIQVVTSLTTVATVIITGYFNRKTTREKADEVHERINNKIETMNSEFTRRASELPADVAVSHPVVSLDDVGGQKPRDD